MRKYISQSHIALSVNIGNGSRYIMFMPLLGVGSFYTTSDPEMIKALESHPWFGDKFFLDHQTTTNYAGVSAVEEDRVALEDVIVGSCVEAKDFLSDHGIDSTAVRSREAIKALGLKHGYRFVGI